MPVNTISGGAAEGSSSESGVLPGRWRIMQRALPAILLLMLALGHFAVPRGSGAAVRHEVPPSVTALACVRADGDRLRVLLRVPLESMRDMQLPLREQEFLVISEMGPVMHVAATVWLEHYLKLYEGNRLLVADSIEHVRIALPGDRAFERYATALEQLRAEAVSDSVLIPWRQALMDVEISYRIDSPESRFAIEPELAHLGVRTTTVLRYITPAGDERVLQYMGNPGLVRLDPSWVQSAILFVKLGFLHILAGIDHLLFLLCLVVPFRRLRPLIILVTAFTVAHSITLIASALEFAPDSLWFTPFIETLIALSIVYMAFENIAGARLQRRWVVTFAFGLVHGFGFSFFLRDSLQFAGSHVWGSLLAFNVGVELGQVLVILVAIPLLGFLFRKVVAERMGTILISALVAHTAWHWTLERGSELLEHDLAFPPMDALFLAAAMRWLMLALILVGVVALISSVYSRVMRE